MRYDWKVSQGGRYVDSGTIEADTQKEAMGLVLLAQEEERKAGKREPDKSYSIKCGDSMMSSYGDEFVRSAECTSWTDEPEMDGGGFIAPSLADVGIETLEDMAGSVTYGCAHEWMPSGFGEEKCDHCGKLRDKEFAEKAFVQDTIEKVTTSLGMEPSLAHKIEECQKILDDNGWASVTNPCGEIDLPPVGRAKGGLVDPSFPRIPVVQDFIADKIFPKYKGWGLLNQNFHGEKLRRIVDAIHAYGYRPEEVVSMALDPSTRQYHIEGRFVDRDGSEKWWSLKLDRFTLGLY
tara:strand:- start:1692 stop:2567 length:876 start_codon:yes stop_codon:yes gene_type:complete